MHLFQHDIQIDWKLLQLLNQLERFDAQWPYIARNERHYLEQEKTAVLYQAFASCCRLSNYAIDTREAYEILQQKNPFILQEKALKKAYGYYESKAWVQQQYATIELSENNLKKLHNRLLRYSEDDYLKKGNFIPAKVRPNTATVSKHKNGFKTTLPSRTTEKEIQALLQWHRNDIECQPLIKIAYMAYQLLLISPFYADNDSVLLLQTNLLLLKAKYSWIMYAYTEHFFEPKQKELIRLQKQLEVSDNSNIYPWIYLFLELLAHTQQELKQRVLKKGKRAKLASKQRSILQYIEHHPECKSGEIAAQLHLANSSTKKLLHELCALDYIKRQGKGAGCNYVICY